MFPLKLRGNIRSTLSHEIDPQTQMVQILILMIEFFFRETLVLLRISIVLVEVDRTNLELDYRILQES